MAKSKLGIGLGISDRVYVGKINQEKQMWVGNKEDITNQFIDVMSSFIPSDKRRYIDSIKDGEIVKTNIFYNIVKDKESIKKAIANLTKELESLTTIKVISDKMHNILTRFYSQIVTLRTRGSINVDYDFDYQKTVGILNDVFKNLNEELNIEVIESPHFTKNGFSYNIEDFKFKDSNEIVEYLNSLESVIYIYDLYLKGGEIYLRMSTEV